MTVSRRVLWGCAVATMFGDLFLTYYGVVVAGLVEGNPFTRLILDTVGFIGFIGIKMGVLGLGVIGWWVLPRKYRVAIPLALLFTWGTATLINITVLM